MTKPLSTLDCARQLGMSDEFIRGEIRDQRLHALRRLSRSGRRSVYRIDPDDFARYLEQHWRFTGNVSPTKPT